MAKSTTAQHQSLQAEASQQPPHQHQVNDAPTTTASNSKATTATLNTPELLEHILTYLEPLQLLRLKRINHSFRNAINLSPTLRRSLDTFLRLADRVDETDLFKSDAGGEVVFPVKGLEVLAFFYPEDAEKRFFVRFGVDEGEVFRRLRKSALGQSDGASVFGALMIVDLHLRDVRVGWHCGCFREGRAEACISSDKHCKGEGEVAESMVRFGDVFKVMENRHVEEGFEGCCAGVRKFWVDGLWERSREFRELGR